MGSIGMTELIFIFLVVLMLFGSKRLPELARGLGKGLREFKRAANELKRELDVQPIKRDFENEIKGNLDEIKRDLSETIHSEPKQVGSKSSDGKN
ncbi:MAG: twin-arginine translocase TatA/TatE family subunit [bacterium]